MALEAARQLSSIYFFFILKKFKHYMKKKRELKKVNFMNKEGKFNKISSNVRNLIKNETRRPRSYFVAKNGTHAQL